MSDRYVLISTDSHAGPTAETYRAYVDPRYRGAFDDAARQAQELSKFKYTDEREQFLSEWNSEIGGHGGMQGAYDPAVRDQEMDHDGVAAEVIFPDADAAGIGGVSATPFTAGLGSTGADDPELTLAGAWAHNRWLAEFCQSSPERRAGVAIVPMHDVAKAVELIEWAAGHNLRGGIMIPTKWVGLPSYSDRAAGAHPFRRGPGREGLRVHARPDRDLRDRGVLVGRAPALVPHPRRGLRAPSEPEVRAGRERRLVGA